ncbi:5-formyltetrahydrofolate cyclo-ligase [Arundinibacter roseus]|uniref:5-formyltetrahydrofolate cyclo-ligase n=1 Tax=Arundinibacter roseus TaxID=2070510 RepID=A0A4R4K318_9BACT|nr:5-formyltetrahydrofolate cyclo-ligase [Arundinibacter roseus]TDB60449.1 5-formyltetrahydrofolate cyclo-ligase [Arundinibacter roseus]
MPYTKRNIRTQVLKKRSQMRLAERETLSHKIANNLMDRLLPSPAAIIHSFISHDLRQEVDTVLIQRIVGSKLPNLRWVAPRIIPGTRRMEHFYWNDSTTLHTNKWGIQEPDPLLATRVEILDIDIVLVPLLACDRRGHRVGYGGGFYDRFLAECRPEVQRIGLSFEQPLDEITDVSAWDIPLHACITPEKSFTLPY